MRGGGRGAGLNGPLVCSRGAAASSLGRVFCPPEGLGDPENIVRGRYCSLPLSPAQIVTDTVISQGFRGSLSCWKWLCGIRVCPVPLLSFFV